jgi:hypothetical protein
LFERVKSWYITRLKRQFSIYWLADHQEEYPHLWNELGQACIDIADSDNTVVLFRGYSRPVLHQASGQRVRRLQADLSDVRHRAAIVFHVGVSGRYFFTGYDDPGWVDHFAIQVGKHTYHDNIHRVDRDEPGYDAWWVVSPLKMTMWDAFVARLIEGTIAQDDKPWNPAG